MRNIRRYAIYLIIILIVAFLLTLLTLGIFRTCYLIYSSFFNPTTIVPPTPTSTTSSPTPTSVVSPAPTTTTYNTFDKVPDVPPMMVRYGGSTSLAPLRSPEIEKRILQAHPGFELVYVHPTNEPAGSSIGIEMLLKSELEIAHSSRSVKPEEFTEARAKGVEIEERKIAIDGIALYVNPDISIPGLTMPEIKDIYTGKIKNWQEVGGNNLEIIPLSRDPEVSGTVEFFQDKVLNNEDFSPLIKPDERENTTEYINLAHDTPGGIGYATASEVCNQKSIKPLPISAEAQNFIAPCNGERVNQAAIADASYPITRPLFVVIKRDGGSTEQAGVAYVNLFLSDEGQQIVEEAGLVPIR